MDSIRFAKRNRQVVGVVDEDFTVDLYGPLEWAGGEEVFVFVTFAIECGGEGGANKPLKGAQG